MTNYKMVIQYDGTRYKGWQKQGNTEQTIQGKLEAVLEKMAGHPVEVQGSGRTDAGAHALGQVANFKLEEEREGIRKYLNQYLPEDIAVLQVEKAEPRFHSRLSAVDKTYLYRIRTGDVSDVFNRKYIWQLEERLNLNAMREASKILLGEHDFTSFCGNRHMKKSAVRKIYQISIQEELGEIQIRFTGNGFLQNMVRILVGTLVEIGQGKRPVESMTGILEGRNRDLAGVTAPAEGLALESVSYEEKVYFNTEA